jgi:hypothetical protein
MRLLGALVAALVVFTGLFFALPIGEGQNLEQVATASAADAATAADTAARSALDTADASRSSVARSSGVAQHDAVETEQPGALPLTVSIDALSSAVVPKRGPLHLRGTITNTSDETWSDLNVYACTSRSPITTAHDLAHASAATTDDVVCGRTSVFTTIEEIAPGKSAAYRLRVERNQLGIGSRPGAYWFGVQALGTSTAGRDAVADGTIRTFLPQVPDRTGPGASTGTASFAVMLPFRGRTLHTADGQLAAADTWADYLSPGGRLDNMLRLAEAAPVGTASLLVDPAVLAAAQQIAAGNPPRGLGAAVAERGDDENQTDGEQSADASADSDEGSSGESNPDADVARDWLERFVAVSGRLRVLALPYGDLDVAGAAHHDERALVRAREQSTAFLDDLEIQSLPVIASPNGLLSDEARVAAGGATVIVGSDALPEELAQAEQIPSVVRVGSQLVQVAESALATGGPAPTNGHAALALRQRLLAEGVVRAGTGEDSHTLVVLPYDADPGPDPQRFFRELDRPFVRLTTGFGSSTDAVDIEGLAYPAGQLEREITASAFAAADHLTTVGGTLDRLLPDNDGLGRAAAREALSGTSYFARHASLEAAGLDGALAEASVRGADAWFAERLTRVDVAVPKFVILGSTTGAFAMTVTNDLERPVRLGVRATTSGGLEIRAPRTIDVPASSSRTVNLRAETTEPGVHSLVLVVTDQDGEPVRKSQDISIRSRDVGWVIWVIMASGAVVLFGAIGMRLRKRHREGKA